MSLQVFKPGSCCCSHRIPAPAMQNQNPFQTFTGLWRSLPRAAKFLLLWAALQSAITIAYASAIFATPQASQEFVFPLLVRRFHKSMQPMPGPWTLNTHLRDIPSAGTCLRRSRASAIGSRAADATGACRDPVFL